MAQVIVRNIEDEVKAGLKLRALQHGWSMEEEVRQILRQSVCQAAPARAGLGTRIAARFVDVGLTEPLTELRGEIARPMDLGA